MPAGTWAQSEKTQDQPFRAQVLPQAKEQLALSRFVLEDLQFTLLSAPPPDSESASIESWIASTRTRLTDLKTIGLETGLSEGVYQCIGTAESFLSEYSAFQKSLRALDFVEEVRAMEGDRSWRSEVLPIFCEATKLAGKNSVQAAIGLTALCSSKGLSLWEDSLRHDSLVTKVASRKKAEVDTMVRDSRADYYRALENLRKYSGSLSAIYNEPFPSFSSSPNLEQFATTTQGKPFSAVAAAYACFNRDQAAAANFLILAANSLPKTGGSAEAKMNRHYRVPYFLMAGHLFEFQNRLAPTNTPDMAAKSIKAYEAALQLAENDFSSVPDTYLVSYARALVAAGKKSKASEVNAHLQKNLPSDTYLKAARLYDLACLDCLLGEEDRALAHLTSSFNVRPRRDPRALADPELAPLLKKHATEMRDLVDHPLVGGEWILGDNYLRFFCDGTLVQRRFGTIYNGTWASKGGQLTLAGRSQLPDATCPFEIESGAGGGESLTLTNAGQAVRFARADKSLSRNQQIPGRVINDNGEWYWADSEPAFSARYSTSITSTSQKREFWFSQEHPLWGRMDQQVQSN